MFRGAEPLCGCAAQGRKRAGRGYMLPFIRVEHGPSLRQRMLPTMREQKYASRTAVSTWFSKRTIHFCNESCISLKFKTGFSENPRKGESLL